MEETLVIIERFKTRPGYSRVAVFNQVTKEWVFNAPVVDHDILEMMEDLFTTYVGEEGKEKLNGPETQKRKAATLFKIDKGNPLFIELKNKRYKVQEVTF